MTTPKLRFKEFDDNKFGKWKEEILGKVSDIRDGTHDSPKYLKEGYPLITSKNLKNGRLDYSDINYISKDDFENINKRSKVSTGDIIFGMIGTIGNPVLLEHEGFAIKNVALIKEKEDLLNSFLIHYLNGNSFENQVRLLNAGNTQKFLALGQIRSIKVIKPTLEEQTKIASFLSQVDKKIQQLNQKHELLNQYKQGMMQKLFSQQIRFKADDGRVFGEWVQQKLGYICQRNYQGINTVADKVEYQKNGYPILQAKHITSEKLDFADVRYLSDADYEKYKDKYIPQLNDILFSNIGTIGKVVLVDENRSFFIAWNIFLMSIKLNIANPSYITAYLRWLTSLNYFDNLQTGNATKFINKTDLLDTKVNLPCFEEQTKIANFLSAIDQKIAVVAEQIEQAKTWKKGLLQQMFV